MRIRPDAIEGRAPPKVKRSRKGVPTRQDCLIHFLRPAINLDAPRFGEQDAPRPYPEPLLAAVGGRRLRTQLGRLKPLVESQP
jgi:hypothetical protein